MGRLTGDYLAAAGALEQSLAISRDFGNRHGQANALGYLGIPTFIKLVRIAWAI